MLKKLSKIFSALIFVLALWIVVEYIYYTSRGNPLVFTKLEQNTRQFLGYFSQLDEKLHFERESISKGACAITMTLNNGSHMAEVEGCKLPNLDPFQREIMRAIRPVTSLNCTGRLFTEYKKGTFRLLDDVSKEHEIAEIFAQPIYRVTDYQVTLGEKKFVNLTNRAVNVNCDFLKVTIRFENGAKQTDFHASISEIPAVAARKETHSAPLNIMILTFDGTSAAHFERLLPKTYSFLKDKLDAIIFKGYSIVGEATTPAMTALLTGKSVAENCEIKEGRRGRPGAGYVDEWPIIFKDLKRLGIATMWSEDQPSIGAFHFLLKGFKNQPSDHFGRPLWLVRTGVCMESQPQFEVQLKYLKSFMSSYPGKRKFGFTFLSSLCHREPGLLHAADNGLLSFFTSLKDENVLNDTMFITMADHGARFGVVRRSIQGKLEQRLPFLSLIFPPWFKHSYPEQMAALVKNARIISSPFDLHATLKHLLTFPEKSLVQKDTIGKSLFEPLPEERTCSDAGIPEFYCPCLRWQPVSIAHPHALQAVKVAVNHVNELLMSHPLTAKLCHRLELKTLLESYQQMPSLEKHLNFDLENTTCSYQIKFQVTPSDGLYEGLLRMDTSGRFKVYGEIDRVNRYGNQPRCVAARVPSMRPYCFCK